MGAGALLSQWHFGSRSRDPRKMGLGAQDRKEQVTMFAPPTPSIDARHFLI